MEGSLEILLDSDDLRQITKTQADTNRTEVKHHTNNDKEAGNPEDENHRPDKKAGQIDFKGEDDGLVIAPDIIQLKKKANNNQKYEKEIKSLKEQNQNLKLSCEDYLMEKERLLIEKDKLEIELQKTVLGINMVDYDNKILKRKNQQLKEKVTFHKENALEKKHGNSSITCNYGEACLIF